MIPSFIYLQKDLGRDISCQAHPNQLLIRGLCFSLGCFQCYALRQISADAQLGEMATGLSIASWSRSCLRLSGTTLGPGLYPES